MPGKYRHDPSTCSLCNADREADEREVAENLKEAADRIREEYMADLERGSINAFVAVKDSGARQSFDTGSVRDTQEGKPRLDLIPALWLTRLGNHLANGAVKYGDNNWQKGQPLTRYYGSAMRHLVAWREGKNDEDHAAAVAWNILAAMWTEAEVAEGRLPAALDDRNTL